MEVQDNTDTETNVKSFQYLAEHGKEYPIRIIHLLDGSLMIGFVIGIEGSVVMVLRPYLVEASTKEDDQNDIVNYELVPYLDQLVGYDPNTLEPMSIMLSSAISLASPADHLATNYQQIINMKSLLGYHPEGKILLKDRQNPSMRTIH